MYYFAYGTSMNLKEFGKWCESHKVRHFRVLSKQPVQLNDFQLAFDHLSAEYQCGGANLHTSPGQSVDGVLYNISDEDFWIIRKRDGVPGIYDEFTDPVTVYGYDNYPIPRVKLFYVPDERCRKDLKPSKEYMKILIEGARTENLQPSYISKLETIPTLD